MIMITKRDGSKEELDITKIQKYTKDSTKNLENVSQSELELDAQLHFNNNTTSREIAETLIKTAVDKIDIDRPNWTYVASRLFVYNLYHEVGKTLNGTKGINYSHLKTYLEYGENEGKIIKGLKDNFLLDKLNLEIDPTRDNLFNYLGIKTLFDRYLLKDKEGRNFELPQHMFMGISMFLAINETNEDSLSKTSLEYKIVKTLHGEDMGLSKVQMNKYKKSDIPKIIRTYWATKFYHLISKFEVMLATPTLSNARTTRHQLSSCYIGSTPDNIEGIFDAYKEMAMLSKFGGGIGWDWTKVRSIGSQIDNNKGAGGGTIPFLKITNDIAIAVDQLGCVAKGSYIKVLKTVETENFVHDFRKEYSKIDFSEEDLLDNIAAFASNFAFSYGKFSKNFISSLLFDYIKNSDKLDKILTIYGITRDQYKNIIGKYKKLNKGLPEGFEILKKDNNYLISKEGMAINNKTLKPIGKRLNRKGYVIVSIGKKSIPLHKLLVEQYIQSNIGDLTINHKDGNKQNNNLDNFEIISNEKNISKGWKGSYKKRTEMARIRKHLSNGIKLNGNKRNTHKIKIKKIEEEIIPIEKARIGDLVKSYNITTNKVEYKAITSKYDIEVKVKDQILITFENGTTLLTSEWHPTPKFDNEGVLKYVRADMLKSGDISINEFNKKLKIKEISRPKNSSSDFIDLTVKDNSNYFATSNNKNNSFALIHNTRKGAIAVYLEPWHQDINDFLDLKKNSGEERRRAHDLFPALWLNDLFMERVQNNENWTLFDPYEVKDLTDLYGKEFEKKYIEYENDETKSKEIISAKQLWKKILTSYFETGTPFLTFKDNANKRNPNNHEGIIRSSNLCTEIFQNTEPNKYKVKVIFENGETEYFEEEEEIKLDNGITKPANKITSIDKLNGKNIYFVEKEKENGKTAVCNLASVNLSRVNTDKDMKRVVPLAQRILDNVIDLNFYPVEKVKQTNMLSRAIGMGVMGEAQMLAEEKIEWGSQEHFEKIDEIMEYFSYYIIEASANLSEERGSYDTFEGSNWNNGILPIDNANDNAKLLTKRPFVKNWDKLREKVKKGMRNGYLMAIAPTSSISILTGTSQAIEPVYKRKWLEENLSGMIPVVAPNLNIENYQYYTPAYEIEQDKLIKAGAVRQKWIDQGQSLNIFLTLDKASGKVLNDLYFLAWLLGLKSTYYLRTESPEMKEETDVVDRSIECAGCQ